MKKALVLLLCLLAVISLSACNAGSEPSPADTAHAPESTGAPASQEETASGAPAELDREVIVPADVDLTKMTSTAVFGEVSDMLYAPQDYVGKVVRMSGTFNMIENPVNGQQYYCCLIADATACCQQGLEFILEGEASYPQDYPRQGEEITVTGRFETYDEDGLIYCHLVEAVLD